MSNTKLRNELARKISLEPLRYSQVWEDHLLLERGLGVAEGDDVLSIGSAGDNALALLLAGARSVLAVDMSPAQCALLELKLAAIARIELHSDFVAFLGLKSDAHRMARYQDQLRGQLSEQARGFWDTHLQAIGCGVVHSGRLERYIGRFRSEHLAELWSEELIEALFSARSIDEQAALFLENGLQAEFKRRFLWYFGREMMAENGRDPAQFEFVGGGDVGAHFLRQFTHVCTTMDLASNPYLWMFLRGYCPRLDEQTPYLQPRNFELLKSRLNCLEVRQNELEHVLGQQRPGAFSKANLSDIFEYMSSSATQAVFSALARCLRPGGRIAYWNLLVPRQPAIHSPWVSNQKLAHQLWQRDRAWFYRSFHLESLPA